MRTTEARGIVREVQGAALPDGRLQDRLESIVKAVESRPASGFPQVFPSEAELEGFYRFVRNDRVSWEAIVAPHVRQTAKRAQQYETVVVAHDTVEFRFGGRRDRDGLTRGRSGSADAGARAKQGYWCQFSLAVAPDEHRAPLGVVAIEPWARGEQTPTKLRKKGTSYAEASQLPSEQDRWKRSVDRAAEQLADRDCAIHVMDSEADDYRLLAQLTDDSTRFVVRMCYDRVLADEYLSGEGRRVKQFVAAKQPVCNRKVRLSRRASQSGRPRRRDIARDEREATLSFRAAHVAVRRPTYHSAALPELVAVNVIHVSEAAPPEGVEPVDWVLATSEPIGTEEQILQVVEYYRARWRIEEFFKALKTGCAYEKRQLESLDTLLVALAVFIPIAWQLLHLRTLSRRSPDQPAQTCLTARQLRVLALANDKLPNKPTVRDALLAIARLGGHLKRNGPPGWQTLGRGFLELLSLERGFVLASSPEM
jgi:hypothetical protein